MPPDHETLDALRRLARDKGATGPERAAARAAAKRLEAKIGKRPRSRRGKAQRAGLPEPPTWRRRRIVADALQGALDRLGRLGDRLLPLHLLLFCLPVLAIGGVGLAWLVGYRIDPDVFLYAMLIKCGTLTGLMLLALVTVAPMSLVVWWLRTARQDRPRSMLLWLLERAGDIGIPAGIIGVCFLAEGQLKAQGWLGKYAALLAGWGIAMVLVGPVAWLYGCWFRRSIESNAPWIDRLAPWAPRVIAAGLTLAIGVPTAWAAYAFTRPPPLVVHEYPNPAPDVHGAAAAMAGYRLLGHACLDAPPRQWWYESRPTRPDHAGCRRDDVYELALRIAGEIKEKVRANSEQERLPRSTRAGASATAP